jgi:hypothetical protein
VFPQDKRNLFGEARPLLLKLNLTPYLKREHTIAVLPAVLTVYYGGILNDTTLFHFNALDCFVSYLRFITRRMQQSLNSR